MYRAHDSADSSTGRAKCFNFFFDNPLYGGDLRRMVRALADTGRLTYADTERLLRWLGEYQAENPEYDYE